MTIIGLSFLIVFSLTMCVLCISPPTFFFNARFLLSEDYLLTNSSVVYRNQFRRCNLSFLSSLTVLLSISDYIFFGVYDCVLVCEFFITIRLLKMTIIGLSFLIVFSLTMCVLCISPPTFFFNARFLLSEDYLLTNSSVVYRNQFWRCNLSFLSSLTVLLSISDYIFFGVCDCVLVCEFFITIRLLKMTIIGLSFLIVFSLTMCVLCISPPTFFFNARFLLSEDYLLTNSSVVCRYPFWRCNLSFPLFSYRPVEY